jgi:NADH:ubiquinone oxidoreductase subunit F (NADH-binding)
MSTPDRAPAGLPRLLSEIPPQGPMSFPEHLALHGEAPLASSRRERREAVALIDQIEHAGLLGRGGAAFPTAAKMRAVARASGRPIVVVNGAEGEPASLKDRTLLTSLPHLVLDGGLLAAQALAAKEIIVCIPEHAEDCLDSLEQALSERHQLAGSPAVGLASVPDRYVAGQESALVNHLSGRSAIPAFTPPLPVQRGVRRHPTLVNNTETLAQIALIARHGPQWFRGLGTTAQPGSTLITLSGPVAYPGVYEIEHGASLASLIDAAGGTTTAIRAVLLGGYAGAWVDAARLGSIVLSNEQLAPHGASLGAGVVLLLSEHACPVAETARIARWLAEQSAGQCGPCVHGLDAIAGAIEEVTDGSATAGMGERIARWCTLASGRGACRHPDGAVRFITSALRVFAEEFADHTRHGRCDACANAPELPLPNHNRVALAAVA